MNTEITKRHANNVKKLKFVQLKLFVLLLCFHVSFFIHVSFHSSQNLYKSDILYGSHFQNITIMIILIKLVRNFDKEFHKAQM